MFVMFCVFFLILTIFLLHSTYDNQEIICLSFNIETNPLCVKCTYFYTKQKSRTVINTPQANMAVFCTVAPCSLAEVFQCLRGTCCFQHQDLCVKSISILPFHPFSISGSFYLMGQAMPVIIHYGLEAGFLLHIICVC